MSFENYEPSEIPDYNEWGGELPPYAADTNPYDHDILPTELSVADNDTQAEMDSTEADEIYPEVSGFRQLNEGQPHYRARTEVNAKLVKMARDELGVEAIERAPVPDEYVDWDTDFPGYEPPLIDLPHGSTSYQEEEDTQEPADPPLEPLVSLETETVQRDEQGYPLNPMGRTGLRGRGILHKLGPIPAADLILKRSNPDTQDEEVLLIQRKDSEGSGEWAIPGGKIDPGENARQAAMREAIEEAGVQNVQLNLSTARVIYAGYADDSRNTDNAWMETTVICYRLNDKEARAVAIEAGTDAAAAQWVINSEELYTNLFASHGQYLRLANAG